MSKLEKFKQLLTLLGPPIMMAVGVPPAVIPMLQKGIAEAEEIHAGKGKAAKFNHAVELANTVMVATNTVKPGTVNVEEVNAVISDGVNLTISTINLLNKEAKDPATLTP